MYSCIAYLIIVSIASFFAGRAIPTQHLRIDRRPFRASPFEREGRIYEHIGIRKWKDRVPDMSRLCRCIMPSKQLRDGRPEADRLDAMIAETCVAELVHASLVLLGFGCVCIRPTAVGWILAILYALGNLPYILIQRYNRPRLARLRARVARRTDGASQACSAHGDHYGNETSSSAHLPHRTRP